MTWIIHGLLQYGSCRCNLSIWIAGLEIVVGKAFAYKFQRDPLHLLFRIQSADIVPPRELVVLSTLGIT